MAHDESTTDDSTDPFEEIDLSPEAILGERTFEGLFSIENAEREIPVNILTGEKSQAVPSVEQAKAFAKEQSREKPYVAKMRHAEAMAEVGGSPYSACVFHHFSLVGGMHYHKAYSAAWDSPEYDVDVAPDYETGTLTLTVTEADAPATGENSC